MATTGEQVLKIALNLMDEVKKDGSISQAETASYRAKAPSIITVLQTELLPNGIDPVPVTDLNNDLLLEDRTCLTVLPYGLAAHLMLNEDTTIAAYFNARYDELKRRTLATKGKINDVYGVNGGMK